MQKITSPRAVRHFGAVIADVGRGESFVLTAHGRPIALLGPVPPDVTLDEMIESPIGMKKSAEPADTDGA
jgi:antitoxin (DNA-binding transcriptional repressor) of toxin-antitoxin stability system